MPVILQVSAPEIVSGMSGESEAKLRQLFVEARDLAPCIMFIGAFICGKLTGREFSGFDAVRPCAREWVNMRRRAAASACPRGPYSHSCRYSTAAVATVRSRRCRTSAHTSTATALQQVPGC